MVFSVEFKKINSGVAIASVVLKLSLPKQHCTILNFKFCQDQFVETQNFVCLLVPYYKSKFCLTRSKQNYFNLAVFLYTSTMTQVKKQTQNQKLEPVEKKQPQQLALWQGIIEGLSDGILILEREGEIIYANESAKQICHQLNRQLTKPLFVPNSIWNICQILIESTSLFPNKNVVFSDRITASVGDTFALRVQWLNLSQFERHYLLVTLENQSHSLQTIAIAEARIYGLTPSETKVWLLYRANHTYKQIASALYITINTVKKHMKNIHAKRQYFLNVNQE